jgi:outer membrane protein insertion porin family
VEGNFPPHEAFAIGGTNSVRGYEEGAVGSGRSYAVGSGEVSCRMVNFFLLPTLLAFCSCQMGSTWKYAKIQTQLYGNLPQNAVLATRVYIST